MDTHQVSDTIRIAILLPVIHDDGGRSCAFAMSEIKNKLFRDGVTFSHGGDPARPDAVWHGAWLNERTGLIEEDSHILVVAHVPRDALSAQDARVKLRDIESRLHGVYGAAAHSSANSKLYQIEVYVEAGDTRLVAPTANERERRLAEREQLANTKRSTE